MIASQTSKNADKPVVVCTQASQLVFWELTNMSPFHISRSAFIRVHPRFFPLRSSALSAVAILCLFASASIPVRAQDKPADLPIKRVVMFSSGVAFFEHTGQVDGNAQVELKFDVKDINDLLKTMILQDEGGGRVSTVSYGSKDPLPRTLATFSTHLTQNPTLADRMHRT